MNERSTVRRRAVILMFDSMNRHMLQPYAQETVVDTPNFRRLAERAVTFDNFYAGSMPCMPARREMHTGRYNFLHRSWGPLEPFDDSMPEMLRAAGVHTHLVSDHLHYWEDGGANYHTRYSTWDFIRGQEGDPWKGVVDGGTADGNPLGALRRQDQINRQYMPTEAEHSQTLTVDAGLEFLGTNAGAGGWLAQIELFDPHEPFFVPQQYKDRYPHDYEGPEFDWPPYQKVFEPREQIEHARLEYAALVSMCDASLGRVLDAFDEHSLWDDTLLIVNTDHGLLLGEHGWWGKSVQPWYNELVHIPMFVWDPRSRARGDRRAALSQTIDIAPTVLGFFGLEPTPDMSGRDLAPVIADDGGEPRAGALFGIHGGHVNVTDGRYVYMRAPLQPSNTPLEEYTLMPAHMRARFRVEELADWVPAEPMSFTKGIRTIRVPALPTWANTWAQGTLLFDVSADPLQQVPLADDALELRMLKLLRDLLIENDAPASQFERLGIPIDAEPSAEHLLIAAQRDRAAASAQPIPAPEELGALRALSLPLMELVMIPAAREALAAHAPQLLDTEHLSMPHALSLIDIVRYGSFPVSVLVKIDEALSAAEH
ncbi:MAG TPA: sulfatase [Microbacterium sp.]|nr:sulfatase [Microbacterium sp.]